MAQSMTLPLVGALALAGVGAGIQLGHSALAEINPIYYSAPPTRFHSDLVANPPSMAAPQMAVAETEQAAPLGNGCVGCRTYPEEYYPIHDATVDDSPGVYAVDGAKVRVAAVQEQPDPEADRLRSEIERVTLYARGAAEPSAQLASADTAPEPGPEVEEAPTTH